MCCRFVEGRVESCKVRFIDGTFVADRLEGPGKVSLCMKVAKIV